VTVDAATYAAIRDDQAIRALAPVEERTTCTDDGDAWTGFYVYGVETYAEIFAGGDGASGIAYEAIDGEPDGEPFERTRLVDPTGVPEPWFRGISLPRGGGPLRWTMAYVPPITRAENLAPWRRLDEARLDFVDPIVDGPRIREVALRVERPAHVELRLGTTTLVLRGLTGTWRFD
jgi:hypothetical protein